MNVFRFLYIGRRKVTTIIREYNYCKGRVSNRSLPECKFRTFLVVKLLCNADEATLYSTDDPRMELLLRPGDIVVGALSLRTTYSGWNGRIRNIFLLLSPVRSHDLVHG